MDFCPYILSTVCCIWYVSSTQNLVCAFFKLLLSISFPYFFGGIPLDGLSSSPTLQILRQVILQVLNDSLFGVLLRQLIVLLLNLLALPSHHGPVSPLLVLLQTLGFGLFFFLVNKTSQVLGLLHYHYFYFHVQLFVLYLEIFKFFPASRNCQLCRLLSSVILLLFK